MQNSAITDRYPQLYRHDVLVWRWRELAATFGPKFSQREVARLASINERTVRKVFEGTANNCKVWPVAKVLNLDWKIVHDMELKKSEFHLAVKNGKGG